MAGAKLFSGPAPRVRAIVAGAPFLDILADHLLTELQSPDDPFALADAVIFLPNRRAARALAAAFARRTPHALLLPTIRPLGDLDDDPDLWGPEGLSLDVAPAIDPLRRRLELAALVRAFERAMGRVDDPVRALGHADALAELLDAAANAGGANWAGLAALVEDATLAEHWQAAQKFLSIIADAWPARLAEEGLIDPAERRNRLLQGLAARWREAPPKGPVLIAGSTGSLRAVRALMRVVAGLERGAVVLPGLDYHLTDDAWAALEPHHPQAGLKAALADLGIERSDVGALGASETGLHRRRLISEALAPAEATADWLARIAAIGAEALATGVDGLTRIVCASEDSEAAAIAFLLRGVLEKPGATAALITPDRGLATRVSVKLARWGIEAPVAAGLALCDLPRGALALLMLDFVQRPEDPIAQAALAKHPLMSISQNWRAFELEALRGPKKRRTPAAWANDLSGDAQVSAAALAGALEALQAVAAAEATTLSALAAALAAAMSAFAGENTFDGADGEALSELLAALQAHGEALGELTPARAAHCLAALIRSRTVPPDHAGHPRLALWGPLEARLQSADLLVLGGLNEGVWPEAPAQDPYLSRAMRGALGLALPEARLGLSAHDFAQLATAPNVVLTRAARRNGAPSVASRWLWRLQTIARGVGALAALDSPNTDDARRLSAALDAPAARRPARAPAPRPAASLRPTRISVTEVERLIRDPYAVYARRVLGLRALDAVGAEAAEAALGVALHSAVEAFVRKRMNDGEADMAAEVQAVLAALDLAPAALRARAARRADAGRRYAAWWEERRAQGARSVMEAKGDFQFGDAFHLYGRADQIDLYADGSAAIIDVKSGAPPTSAQVNAGLAPQLVLEAAMLSAGAFDGAPRAVARELIYWRFGGADPGAQIVDMKTWPSVEAGAADLLARLTRLMRAYGRAEQPFLSKPRPQFAQRFGDFDHLARRKEWSDVEEGEA